LAARAGLDTQSTCILHIEPKEQKKRVQHFQWLCCSLIHYTVLMLSVLWKYLPEIVYYVLVVVLST